MNISCLQYKDDLKLYDNSKTQPHKVWNILKNVLEDMQMEFEMENCKSVAQAQFTHSLSGNISTLQV